MFLNCVANKEIPHHYYETNRISPTKIVIKSDTLYIYETLNQSIEYARRLHCTDFQCNVNMSKLS